MDVFDPDNNDSELVSLEKSLRPQSFEQVIGRDKEKEALQILIGAAKKRNEAIDHILLHGPPGLGKTSIAHVIAKEANVTIYTTSGPAIEKKGDLVSILTNLEPKAILFIDEIHRLRKPIEEVLYSAMEDSRVDIIIGKGPSARTLTLDLPDISIIGATTRVGMLSSPLRDRFGLDLRLDYYSYEELTLLVLQKAGMLGTKITPEAAEAIARRARRTPRIAQRIFKRVRDLAEVNSKALIDLDIVLAGLKMMDIDDEGMDRLDRKILQAIYDKFKGGPVGIRTLAGTLGEDLETIEDVYEPFLLKEGYLIRTPRGRMLSEKGLLIFGKALS